MQNEHLEHQVNQKLMACEELSSMPIDISADDGQVTLVGTVQSFRRKLKAQEIASACSGVTTVVNELVVDPVKSESDDVVAAGVNKRLEDESRLNHQAIRIDVRSGTVSLTGYVSSQSEKEIAADVAAGSAGVRGINDMLIVNADRVLANSEHCSLILAAIGRIAGMENENLILSVVDETARVSGTVNAIWKKEIAETTIRQFGILNVCNEIAVNSQQ